MFTENKYQLIPLNIVMTYPVHWGKYQILRDFVQNFYDSVGYKNWKNRFHYEYQNNEITMWVDEVTFSYEWLLHIGASTKTKNSDKYAGYFGEGFKIASLCAYRDYKWDIIMSSGNWKLSVLKIEQNIDNQSVPMLAYEVMGMEFLNKTQLVLSNINDEDYEIFLTVLKSFYYPENEIMGEVIWEGEEGAVYYWNKHQIDKELPKTRQFERKGAVFCGFQMLGTNPFGLVVCLHKYKKEDRERRGLYDFEVVGIFESIAYYIDAAGAMAILEKMKRYWNSNPQKNIDIHSWSGVIDSLIYKIGNSPDVKEAFVKKYNNLLCCCSAN